MKHINACWWSVPTLRQQEFTVLVGPKLQFLFKTLVFVWFKKKDKMGISVTFKDADRWICFGQSQAVSSIHAKLS